MPANGDIIERCTVLREASAAGRRSPRRKCPACVSIGRKLSACGATLFCRLRRLANSSREAAWPRMLMPRRESKSMGFGENLGAVRDSALFVKCVKAYSRASPRQYHPEHVARRPARAAKWPSSSAWLPIDCWHRLKARPPMASRIARNQIRNDAARQASQCASYHRKRHS